MRPVFCAALLAVSSAIAQPPAFEAAVVRPHEGELPRTGGTFRMSGSRLSVQGFTVLGLILKAYKIKSSQLAGAPADRTFYDVEATAGEGKMPSEDEFMLMLQSLLPDGAATTSQTSYDGPNLGTLIPATTMEQLAERIRSNAGLDRPVVNQTGLSGTYAVTLKYAPRWRTAGGDADLAVVDHVEKPSAN